MKKILQFVPADPRTIQLDIDSNSELTGFWQRMKWFSCMADAKSGLGLGLRSVEVKKSKSGKHWHVVIKISKPLRIIERIALQAILGSDRDRELCNWERYRFGSTYPILLYQKIKGEVK